MEKFFLRKILEKNKPTGLTNQRPVGIKYLKKQTRQLDESEAAGNQRCKYTPIILYLQIFSQLFFTKIEFYCKHLQRGQAQTLRCFRQYPSN